MKITVITYIAMAVTGTLGLLPLVHAKGARDNAPNSYNSVPKESNVSGYTRKDSTYVAPHYRSERDGVKNNNWTTQGNTNPHTGKDGTIPRSNYEKKK